MLVDYRLEMQAALEPVMFWTVLCVCDSECLQNVSTFVCCVLLQVVTFKNL